MKSSNNELLDLVQILLETYKIKEKGIKLCKESVELNSFVEEIVEEMQGIAMITRLKSYSIRLLQVLFCQLTRCSFSVL